MSNIEKFIKNVPLFQGFEKDVLLSLTKLFNKRSYSRGTILFLEGDIGEECYLIESGTVKIYRFDESREATLALLRKGDYFGEMAMMQKGLTRSATAEVMETSCIYSLKRLDFISYLREKPDTCLNFLEATMDRLRKANEQIYDLTFLDLRSRITKIIKRLADEHGVSSAGNIVIPIKLTHQQLANMVGAIRESVSKILYELQNEQIIRIENKTITILDLGKFKI
jgi:CRP/FNR family cyclic AMP-dependent transcriptional regulator